MDPRGPLLRRAAQGKNGPLGAADHAQRGAYRGFSELMDQRGVVHAVVQPRKQHLGEAEARSRAPASGTAHARQVVAFVLHHAGVGFGLALDAVAVEVEAAVADAPPAQPCRHAGRAPVAFPAFLFLASSSGVTAGLPGTVRGTSGASG